MLPGSCCMRRRLGGRDNPRANRPHSASLSPILVQAAGRGHGALEPGLLVFRVEPRALLRLLPGGLGRRTRLQLARHQVEVVWHLGVGLEEEELEVARLVL